ncbi:hypothetical protein Dimus_037512 [Dionaea muscipula]
MDKGKAPVEVNPKRPTVVPDSAAQTSSTTPFPPQNVRLSCIILDSINQSVEERITATYAMVDDGLYPRDHTILLGTELRRLTGAMMVNVAAAFSQTQLQEEIVDLRRDLHGKIDAESRAVQELHKVQTAKKSAEQMATQQSETIKERRDANQSLKERLEDEKNKRKALVGVLNEYDGRLKVNSIQEFIHSTKFEDSLAKGVNMGRKIDFPIEPYVAYAEEYLPSHSSSSKLSSPFKFVKDWIE